VAYTLSVHSQAAVGWCVSFLNKEKEGIDLLKMAPHVMGGRGARDLPSPAVWGATLGQELRFLTVILSVLDTR
jgi:hypothetical protein